MKGLLENDKSLQKRALEGLIEASNRLGLDATRYRNALKTVSPKSYRHKNRRKPTVRRSRKSSGGKIRLRKTEVRDGRLVLHFNRQVPGDGLRHFILKEKRRVLYVFDLEPAVLPFAIKRIRGEGFKEIRIGQFDPRRVRVVVETRKPYKPTWRIEGESLQISLPGGSLVVRPVAKAVKKSQKRPQHSVASSASRNRQKRPATPVVSKKRAPADKHYTLDRTYTVVIDPGHGGKDGGAVGYRGKREKDAVLALAKRLKTILKKRGYRVYLTRERDRFIPLKRRTRFANRKHADLFISIHANAVPKNGDRIKNRGIETYFLSRARTNRAKRVAAIENSSDVKSMDRYTKEAYLSVLNREKIIESNKLAIDLQRQMLMSVRRAYNGVVDNGVREGPFWVLVGAQMPAVLIEVGYISNPTEALRLFSSKYQNLLAEGIANGIESYVYHNLR